MGDDLSSANNALDGMMPLKIKHSVGKGGSNHPDDVALVQFMLDTIHLDPQNPFRMPSLLMIDGLCGSRSLDGILGYQKYKKDLWFPLLMVDGRVTATPHAILAGPRSFGYSTIYNLNWDFMNSVGRTDQRLFGAYFFEPFFSAIVLPLQKAGILPA